MKKLLLSLACMLGLTAAWAGTGTQSDPYTVADLVAMGKPAAALADKYVKGYIVGYVDGKTLKDGATFNATNVTSQTNILLADAATETNVSNCAPIQLPVGNIRTSLNLQANPGNLGHQVLLGGSVEAYFGVAGLKSTSSYKFTDGYQGGGSTPTTPTGPVTGLDENFAGGAIPAGWTQTTVAGNKQWYVTSYQSVYYAAMTGYKGTAPFDQWLVSPAVDMTKVANKNLSFRTQVNGYGSTTTVFEVYVMNGADPATATKTKLNPAIATAPESGYSSWTESGNLDLSSHSGNIYIAFRYYATTDANYATWCVTDVKLGEAGGGSTVDPTGKGSKDDPYTVADIIGGKTSTDKVWSTGYIVGWVDGKTLADGAQFNANATANTNILIAATPDATDVAACVPVQLPTSVRDALGLQAQPANYKKQVKLFGTLEKYFGTNGIKNTSDYEIVGQEKPADITVATIADFRAKANTLSQTTISSPVTAIYQNGRYLWITDGENNEDFLLVYGDLQTKYTNGQTIPAGITGTYANFSNGLIQMGNPVAATFAEGTAGTAVQPEQIQCEDVALDLVNKYVLIKGVTITAAAEDNTFNMTDGSADIKLYNQFTNSQYYDVVDIPTGSDLNVTGFISVHGGIAQVVAVKVTNASGLEAVADPVFSVAAGTVAAGTKVALSTATAGATIHYTVDGSVPSTSSAVYSEPIVINEATTIKAFAVKEGMANSAVVSAAYTIGAAPQPGDGATFNFTDPTSLTPAQKQPGENGIDVPGVIFTAGGVSLVADGGTSSARLWNCYNHGVELRVYNGGTITVSAPAGSKITKIEIEGDQLETTSVAGTALATGTKATSATWSDANGLEKVKINVATVDKSKRADIAKMVVTLNGAGVSDITADSANAPVEFYNLQGVRVAEENLGAGLYIRRQGRNVTKIVVK